MKTEIVAECAQGFEGSLAQTRLLVKAAAAAGADAVKFQLVYADELCTPGYKHYTLFRSLEMPDESWQEIADYAGSLGTALYLDIFGTRSLQLAERLGLKGIKLHGTDTANIGLLKEVAATSIPRVYLGAGGSHYKEIEAALTILTNKEVVVILGFQGYPTPTDTNHIARIPFLQEKLSHSFSNFTIGFADHEDPASPMAYAVACAAVGAGAVMVEKHLTLGRIMKIEDYESALNPDDFVTFVQLVRGCTAAMGAVTDQPDFGMTPAEDHYRAWIRRHVVTSRALSAGHAIAPEDVILKRSEAPGALTDLSDAYHKTLKRDLPANTAVALSDLL